MALRVNVVCRNYQDDRVLPRFSRYLADRLGWTLTAAPFLKGVDVLYLMGYFEAQMMKVWPDDIPVTAYFTHREEEPPGNDKARLFDRVAGMVDLRVSMAKIYTEMLNGYGPTVQPALPVERKRFVITRVIRGRRLTAGFSGYTYRNRRKGEDLVRGIMELGVARRLEWRASGRGWPVATRRYSWKEMPGFYQGLDVLVCTSRVEGGPMPVLEALACGVSVVIPKGVGILDELPDMPGIYRYTRGELKGLARGLERAVEERGRVEREALRAATKKYSVEAFCMEHEEAFEAAFGAGMDAGLGREVEDVFEPVEMEPESLEIAPQSEEDEEILSPVILPVEEGIETSDAAEISPERKRKRGIYVVAFGDPARTCALRLMKSIKKHMPEIPVALCAAKKIGPEDLLITQPDSDIGGRRAKLKAYDLAPKEWRSVLYLDADTEVVGDIRFYFELIEDGWEFVICKDPHLMDTMHAFKRRNNQVELDETEKKLYTLHTLQYNGGVWAFGRNKRVAQFFRRWQAEWERHAQRDQGALIRAMYTEPLRTYVLGNEWNTFPKYTKGIKTAGLMHYPGDARRWKGLIPGRIDSAEAWRRVEEFERQRRGRGR